MVKIGIVGCGAIYATHAEAINRIAEAEVSGFFDVIPQRSEAAATRFHRPSFSSIEELCDSSDAVSLCVPSGLHAQVGTEIVQRGKHLLVEKPIDVNLKSGSALVAAGRTAGVKLGVISQHRFAPDIRRLQNAMSTGEMGEALQGDAYIKWYRTQKYYDSGDWRGTWKLDGGGCLINQGVHYIDMIQWIMGGVQSVQAQVRTAAHNIEVEDVANALVEYENGAIGVIQGSTSFFPGFAERLEVHAKHGGVIIEGDVANVWEVDEHMGMDGSLYGRGVAMQPAPNLKSGIKSEAVSTLDPADRWIEQHKLQIEDFVESIVSDREPFITGEMALEPLRVILAIYQSARENGRRVQVKEINE